MQNTKEQVIQDIKLKKYYDLISKIARVEYRLTGVQHLVELDELYNIGLQTINTLCAHKEFDSYNSSYLSTAIKWAIRNELRNRYKWYGIKQAKIALTEDEAGELREAIYKSILSTDEMYDSEKSFEIRDDKRTPEENCEFSLLSSSIKSAVMTLPKRERELIESKFYKDKKLHELSDEFNISPSRISRIIKSGLEKIKDELLKSDIV